MQQLSDKFKDKDTAIKAFQAMLEAGIDNSYILSQLKDLKIKASIKNGRIIEESDIGSMWLDRFVTVNPAMLQVKDDVRKLMDVDDAVLIIGPTGTGKEILANALHGKRGGDFIPCNASGLPENLIESELFGHRRGAFTGATSDKMGLIRVAKEGTFFLDEIGELPMEAQSKLLRAIQHRRIRPVGDVTDIETSCRYVFATNRDLHSMVDAGRFRADLLARISTFSVVTTSLKDRPEDVAAILKTMPGGKEFLLAAQNKTLPEAVFNVRSLEQWVKRYKVLGRLP